MLLRVRLYESFFVCVDYRIHIYYSLTLSPRPFVLFSGPRISILFLVFCVARVLHSPDFFISHLKFFMEIRMPL